MVASVRDQNGDPAAIGATLRISKPGLVAQGEGFGDPLRVWTDDPMNEGGIYDVEVSRPWYRSAHLLDVEAPADECGIWESKAVEVRIELLEGAPPIRQVVMSPSGYGFGGGNFVTQLLAFVVADPGASTELVWTSTDSTVVRVEQDGTITSACRTVTGDAWVVANSAVEPEIRDSVSVTVFPPSAAWAHLCP